MADQKYTPEGLPIVTPGIPLDEIFSYDEDQLDELLGQISKDNPVLSIALREMVASASNDDVRTGHISAFCVLYELLRKQGAAYKQEGHSPEKDDLFQKIGDYIESALSYDMYLTSFMINQLDPETMEINPMAPPPEDIETRLDATRHLLQANNRAGELQRLCLLYQENFGDDNPHIKVGLKTVKSLEKASSQAIDWLIGATKLYYQSKGKEE